MNGEKFGNSGATDKFPDSLILRDGKGHKKRSSRNSKFLQMKCIEIETRNKV